MVTPGVVPHVNASHNMRISNLAVTCSPYEAEETALIDPMLIVEILSPSNQAETWANVWAYTTIPSVREILVLGTAAIGWRCCAVKQTVAGRRSRNGWLMASWI